LPRNPGLIPDLRPPEQIREHYEVEKELAGRLRAADREARRTLYMDLYEELYRRVPHHMKLTEKISDAHRAERIERQLRWLRPSLGPESVFLEVGAGDCAVTLAAAEIARKAIAVEVSPTIAANADTPPNFELLISDGTSIPVPPGSVDVVYSQQLMEHLHPEDALDQLRNIFAALAPGGRYFCSTPNRLTGPHDISRYFDKKATGFHLKEYTVAELARLFRRTGFRDVRVIVNTTANMKTIPVWPVAILESVLRWLPRGLRLRITPFIRPRVLYNFRLLATK
jgi:SAM-dependent methyltransferase